MISSVIDCKLAFQSPPIDFPLARQRGVASASTDTANVCRAPYNLLPKHGSCNLSLITQINLLNYNKCNTLRIVHYFLTVLYLHDQSIHGL